MDDADAGGHLPLIGFGAVSPPASGCPAATGVLKVRHGIVQEVGIADRHLLRTRGLARRLLAVLA